MMMTTKVLGLLSVAMTTAMTVVALPAMAQRVCIESESTGRIVCGRVVNDSRSNDNRYNDRYDERNNNRYDERNNNRYDERNNSRYDGANSFDERFYLMAYPDVRAAIDRRQIKDAYAHYQNFGRFEGRFPRLNEASYLAKNPDVAEAVKRGSIRSGYEHWLRNGRFENRKL